MLGRAGTGSVHGRGLRTGTLTDLLRGLRVGGGKSDHVVSGKVGVVGVDFGSWTCAGEVSMTCVIMLAILNCRSDTLC